MPSASISSPDRARSSSSPPPGRIPRWSPPISSRSSSTIRSPGRCASPTTRRSPSSIATRFAEVAGDAVRQRDHRHRGGPARGGGALRRPPRRWSRSRPPSPPSISRSRAAAAESLRASVRNAGAVFVGSMSPVSIGDYVAGPNHTLPTQGAARYRGPLAVMDFVRWPSVVHLSDAEFDALAPVAICLAEAEGLAAHEGAIRARHARRGRNHDVGVAHRHHTAGHARDADQRGA